MSSNDIRSLTDREHVRTRVGMYLGSTDSPYIAVREIIDNSMDEVLQGRASSIWCYTSKLVRPYNGSDYNYVKYTVADNGGGIPIKATVNEKDEVITMTELAEGSLRAGSKFNKTDVQTGLNGIGSSAICFVSTEFIVYSKLSCHNISESTEFVKNRCSELGIVTKTYKLNSSANPDEWYYCIKFNEGLKVYEDIVNIKSEIENGNLPEKLLDKSASTITTFLPDPYIWKSQECKIPMNFKFLRHISKLNGNELHFYVNDKEDTEEVPDYGYNFQVRCNNPIPDTKNPWMDFIVSFGVSEQLMDYGYVASVNGLEVQSGKHIKMVRNAYCNAFQSIFGSCQGKEDLGIDLMIIMQCFEPVFSSQTKETLYDVPEFNYNSLPALEKAFKKVILDNRDVFEQNYYRILKYLDSINQLGKLGKIKAKVAIASEAGSKSAIWTPIKLKDASSRDRSRCELYICFSGDTEFLDCNLNKISMLEMKDRFESGEEVYTMSIKPNGEVIPAKVIKAGFTGMTKQWAVVTLDNGEKIKCTPDHKFIMRDGSVKEARELSPNELLLPNNLEDSRFVTELDIIDLDEEEPTYCLTVDNEFHNIPLAAGVWVKQCEGNSAMSPMLSARDASIHAVLPLRGKIKNSTGMDITDTLENYEWCDIINAIGTGVNDYFDLSEVRYGKIIIAADADADGANINALCLGGFMTHLTYLIKAGYVYIAEMPLFVQNGVMYYKSDGSYKLLDKTKPFTRFKGLGEMDTDELRDSLFNPETRRLLRVTFDEKDRSHVSAMLTSSLARRELMVERGILSEMPYTLKLVKESEN